MKMSCFVRDGELNLPGHTREMIKQKKDGSYVMDLSSEKSKATASMFGFLFGSVYPSILKEMGEFRSVENIKKLDKTLKERFGPSEIRTKYELRKHKIFEPSKTGTLHKEGKPFVKISEEVAPKSKAKYTVDEMSQYWDALRQFAGEFFNLTLKDPDPEWKKHWVDEKDSK